MLPIDHLQVTVRDIGAAEAFYDKLMPLLGFDLAQKVRAELPEFDLVVVEYLSDAYDFGVCSPRTAFRQDSVHRRKPGAMHHLAFRASSRAEVDRLYREIARIGARIVHAPRIFEEHGPHYYALFFKDPDGVKYEIVCNKPQ